MNINEENLENALSNNEASVETEQPTQPEMSKEMEIGFHQGALNTLAAERSELIKIVQNVEKIMGMHIERMKALGINFEEKKE